MDQLRAGFGERGGRCAYLLWLIARGRPALPPWKELLALLGIGLITQLGGVLLVWAMSVVGAAVSVTLQTGIMLAASAVLGLIVLGERVSWRQIAAIALITVSVAFFSLGVESTDPAGVGQALSRAACWGSPRPAWLASHLPSSPSACGRRSPATRRPRPSYSS